MQSDTSNEEHKEGYLKWFTAYINKNTKPFTVAWTYNCKDEKEKARCWVLNRG